MEIILSKRVVTISEEVWENIHPEIKEAFAAILEEIEYLKGTLGKKTEQLNQNSKNSSIPPSQDPYKKPESKSSGGKRGGQVGHKGSHRKLVPIEEVKEVVKVKPEQCSHCGNALEGEDKAHIRHQVIEIPSMAAYITEYQLHRLTCDECGKITSSQLPPEVPFSQFGPRLQALIALLSGKYHQSKREIEQLVADAFGVNISLGSVSHLEEVTSNALEIPVAEVEKKVKSEPVLNMDETSWKEKGKKVWLWTAVAQKLSFFFVKESRESKVIVNLLGEVFTGIVGSDRYPGYNFLGVSRRQLCWAHLIRDFQAWCERGGDSKDLGFKLLSEAYLMFELWDHLKEGMIDRVLFQELMIKVIEKVDILLINATTSTYKKTQNTAKNILKLEPALWTFIFEEGVEPTNNTAERALRTGVLWRRKSFGTQGDKGSRFIGRMLTVVATLKQQKRNVLEYLTEVCSAFSSGKQLPSLLPQPT